MIGMHGAEIDRLRHSNNYANLHARGSRDVITAFITFLNLRMVGAVNSAFDTNPNR